MHTALFQKLRAFLVQAPAEQLAWLRLEHPLPSYRLGWIPPSLPEGAI